MYPARQHSQSNRAVQYFSTSNWGDIHLHARKVYFQKGSCTSSEYGIKHVRLQYRLPQHHNSFIPGMRCSSASNLTRSRHSHRLRRPILLSPPLLCPLSSTRSILPRSFSALTVDTFFPQYVRFFKVLDWVNLVSLVFVVVYCILWVGVLYRCPKSRLRSRYVMGTAVALVFWHIPGLMTLIAAPRNVLCMNEITRATQQNHLCAVQGTPYLHPDTTFNAFADVHRIFVCVFYSCRGTV